MSSQHYQNEKLIYRIRNVCNRLSRIRRIQVVEKHRTGMNIEKDNKRVSMQFLTNIYIIDYMYTLQTKTKQFRSKYI